MENFRKKIFFLCCLILFVTFLFFEQTVLLKAEGQVMVSEDLDWEYTLSGNDMTVTAYKGNAVRLVIPNKIDGYSVVKIGERAFESCDTLVDVSIPNSVTSIESWAFYKCSYMASIVIPDSVVSMGEGAFCECRGLTSIQLPKKLTTLENWIFYGCSSLTEIEVPSGVTSIGNNTFLYCQELVKVIIPSSVTAIDKKCFGYSEDSEWKYPKNFKIFTTKNSYAVTYASDNKIEVAYLEDETVQDQDMSSSVISSQDSPVISQEIIDQQSQSEKEEENVPANQSDGQATQQQQTSSVTTDQGKIVEEDNSVSTDQSNFSEKGSGKQSKIKKGNKFYSGRLQYKITTVNGGSGKVSVVGIKNKNVKKVVIPEFVNKYGVSFQVTAIASKAFLNCRKIKKFEIRSKYIVSIGKKAFKNVNKKAKYTVPRIRLKKYSKMIKKAGGRIS